MLSKELAEMRQQFHRYAMLAAMDGKLAAIAGKQPWDKYDSSLASIQKSFKDLIPGGDLQAYVSEVKRKHQARGVATFHGIEVMGPGSLFFSQFQEGIFTATAGITLTDTRPPEIIRQDTEKGHSLIVGDAFSPEFPSTLDQWLEGDTLDVVVIRPLLGQALIPPHPLIIYEAANTFYKKMREGSVMFAEIPLVLNFALSDWDILVDEIPGIDIYFGGGSPNNKTIRLEKQQSAPKELPALPVKYVMRWKKEWGNFTNPHFAKIHTLLEVGDAFHLASKCIGAFRTPKLE